ncbi:B-cell scaffold protein with ankyrin repeats-like [Spea bombifrons]|uniref:B-cell scaffold protein with ankyrin repeats-like n=1 Tax=Spea bombifrons TaxID=233779 RepID=UPI00234AD880|nr:B-cell scaffold protein with ankyrin repeats-like [Spea bombifrons]
MEWASMENEYVHSSKYVQENTVIPLLIDNDEEENQNKYNTLTDDLPLKYVDGMEDRTMINCAQDNQEECDPENLIWNQDSPHQEEGHKNEDYEEPVIVASTEDDVYIVFHTSIKHRASTAHHPKVPEPSLTSGHQSTASYFDPGNQETDNPESDNENISWDEQAKCPKEENENYDDPPLLAVTHDDMYIEFQSKHIPVQQPPCPAYYSPEPEPSPSYNFELGRTISDIGQAAGEDANYENIYWDDGTDECTYSGEEDPYSLAYSDDSMYMEFPLETDDPKTKRGTNSFIVHRAPAPAPRPGGSATVKHGSYISQVFQQQERKVYGIVEHSAPIASDESQGSLQQYVPAGQDELILLQEKVKQGIITMDEALQKFHQWQNEKSGLDLLQQKKLQQLRDSIIGDKLEDEKLYDKITIVHQPNVRPPPQRTRLAAFDNSIYQRPLKPEASNIYCLFYIVLLLSCIISTFRSCCM